MMIRLCLSLLIFGEIYIVQSFQPRLLLAVHAGDTVTFPCLFSPDEAEYICWFKQTVGEKPRHIATTLKYSRPKFYNEFDHERFQIHSCMRSNNLTISKIEASDFATYLCLKMTNYEMTFLTGTSLVVKGFEKQKSNGMTVVQRPVSESIPAGDSVTLQCTVDSGICAGEHNVYWFRRGSGESLPGLIYTHGNRSDEAGSPTQSCVYSLPKRNLSRSDAGTYYCAVATCGEILFGNGTKLDTEGLPEHSMDAVVLGLAVSLGFCVIGIIVLLTTRNTKFCDHCTVAASHVSHNDDEAKRSSDQNSDAENLNYAALRFADKKPENGRKKKELKEETLYSPVRQYWNETHDRMV